MRELPPHLERWLGRLGVNVTWLRWKWLAWQQAWEAWLTRRRTPRGERVRHKHCPACGELARATDTVCVCGRRLPSYTSYRLMRAVALQAPQGGVVTLGFLLLITGLFAWQLVRDFPAALTAPTIQRDWWGRLSGPGVDFGALTWSFLADGQWWRLLGFALSHVGVLHILFNGMATAQLLPPIEEEVGPRQSLLVITVTQLGAAAGVLWLQPHAPTAGASGIAFGLMGFGLAFARRRGRSWEARFYWQWVIYGLLFTFLVPRISKGGHLGGLIAGLLAGHLLARRQSERTQRILNAAGVVCLALWAVTVLLVIASVLHLKIGWRGFGE